VRQAFASSFGRPAAFVLAILLSLTLVSTASAAKYSAIVVDANTGKTLYSSSADSRRYPASLTKMMTLYLTFEALQRGKIKRTSQVKFSAQAAAQPPTKIGVRAGGSISVETAIYALITRSANDASHALAELLGGSEPAFARMMTAKARSLGMRSTVFRNPHGLPNTGQFTTARDMATLGIALREHFPQYYDYFSIRSFKYGKQRIANHNKLLGRVKGVDGIKTGYTRASGFNLVSSVVDGNRKIVAVVMGGTSGRARDNQMAELIRTYLPKASGRGGGGDLVAKSDEPQTLKDLAVAMLPKKKAPMPAEKPDDLIEVGEGDTEEGVEVAEASEEYEIPSAGVRIDAPDQQRFGGPVPTPRKNVKNVKKAKQPEPVEQAYAAPEEAPAAPAVDPIRTASTAPASGWSIQVASSPSKDEANTALQNAAQKAPGPLSAASAYTVEFEKGGTVYHRARFGGFETKTAAWNACNALKKKKISCYATQ